MINKDILKQNSWHIKVMGAYVQQPIPGVYGLEENELISSKDARALYPTTTIYSNISSETLYGRIYDGFVIQNFVSMIDKIFEMKKTMNNYDIKNMITPNFKRALLMLLKDYSKNHDVKNKKEAELVTSEYYPKLLEKIIDYDGKLEDIYTPIDDKTYYLLRSCFFPLIETITWLSPQNKGFSQIIIDYVFHPDIFEKKYDNQKIYLFTDYNSTKLNFKIIDKDTLTTEYFSRYILNSYGSLFYTHSEKLAFEVELNIKGLDDRSIIKDKMLVLEALIAKFDLISDQFKQLFEGGLNYLTETQANQLLDIIGDDQPRKARIISLSTIDFENKSYSTNDDILKYLNIRRDQFFSVQNGIKVSLNSGYGILGMITYEFSDSIAANSITNAGKIYGIKVFQMVSNWVMELYEEKRALCDDENWKDKEWVDLELLNIGQ